MERPPLFAPLSPFGKILMLVLIVLTTFLVTIFLGFLAGMPFFGRGFFDSLNAADPTDPAMLPLMKYFQILSQVGFFVLPPLIFAWLVNRKAGSYLLLNRGPDAIVLAMTLCLFILSMPLISELIRWNEGLRLPGSMAGLEQWMKESESQAEVLTRAFLGTTTLGGFLVNLLMVMILPAFGEELLFRSVLIRLFREWTGNIHAAVVISSILFSLLHFQFYGFFPRLVLGLMLGYVFVWTGSLWIPIAGHLLVNGMAVVVSFLYARGLISTDFESFGSQPRLWEVVFSLVISMALMGSIFYRQRYLRQKVRQGHPPV